MQMSRARRASTSSAQPRRLQNAVPASPALGFIKKSKSLRDLFGRLNKNERGLCEEIPPPPPLPTSTPKVVRTSIAKPLPPLPSPAPIRTEKHLDKHLTSLLQSPPPRSPYSVPSSCSGSVDETPLPTPGPSHFFNPLSSSRQACDIERGGEEAHSLGLQLLGMVDGDGVDDVATLGIGVELEGGMLASARPLARDGHNSSGLDLTEDDRKFSFPFQTETAVYASSPAERLTLNRDESLLLAAISQRQSNAEQSTSGVEKMLDVYHSAAHALSWGYPAEGSTKPKLLPLSPRAEMWLLRREEELQMAMEQTPQAARIHPQWSATRQSMPSNLGSPTARTHHGGRSRGPNNRAHFTTSLSPDDSSPEGHPQAFSPRFHTRSPLRRNAPPEPETSEQQPDSDADYMSYWCARGPKAPLRAPSFSDDSEVEDLLRFGMRGPRTGEAAWLSSRSGAEAVDGNDDESEAESRLNGDEVVDETSERHRPSTDSDCQPIPRHGSVSSSHAANASK